MFRRQFRFSRWFAPVVAVVLLASGLTVGTAASPASAADPALPTVTNPDFGTLSTTGAPSGWRVWNPAGTATFARTAGPGGGTAATITATSGATARYALVQSLDVSTPTARTIEVSAQVAGTNLSATGFSMLRVQAFNAAGQVTVPIARGPYLTGTFDWKPYSVTMTLPAGTTRLSVEPMLDLSGGSISFSRVSVEPAGPAEVLTATATAAGPVELEWTEVENASRYNVLRTTAGSSVAVPVRTAIAATTADETAEPNTTYTYQVQALDAAGTIISRTRTKTVTTPATFADRVGVDIVSALQTEDGAHLTWAAAEATDLAALTVQIGDNPATPLSGTGGSLSLSGTALDNVLLRSGDEVIAEGFVAPSAHPRSFLDTQTVTRVNAELQSEEPTITGALTSIQNRVAGLTGGYSANASGELYRARDAAFLYAVSGEPAYAQQAYDSVVAGSSWVAPRDVNMGLELARAALLLAPAYDWSYNGWTEEQRADVREVMTKAVDLLSTYHHDALDDSEKTSNWVGVVRGTELALLLAARGDADFGMHDRRISFLVDQVNRHLTQGYTDEGISQEGWDYVHYTQLYMFPGIFAAQDSGITALDAQLERPDFPNMALHVLSSRDQGNAVQQGVSGPSGEVQGAFPLFFPLASETSVPGLKHLYDELQGVDSASQAFDGLQGIWTVLFYPTEASSDPVDLTAPEAHTALLDTEEGFFAFRNRYQDEDDTLIGTAGRNSLHRGWSGAETFSLSWMSNDTTWATLGGKHSTEPLLWSKPLVDGKLEPYRNQYETAKGEGVTLDARAFDGQGGGYIELDGSKNFEVDTAHRRQVVDLATGGSADAIVAIDDQFTDDTSHSWDWQLRPEAGVTIAIDTGATAEQPLFTFTSPNGAVMSALVPNRDGLEVAVIDGTLRLTRVGTEARFQIVLVTSPSGAVDATATAEGLVVDNRLVDLDDLAAITDGFAAPVPTDTAQTAPASAALTSDNGWDTGLQDGSYNVRMNMWWGENATSFDLSENGVLVASVPLSYAGKQEQSASVPITGKSNGTYVYTGALRNSKGSTPTDELRVVVTDASPGRPTLSHNNTDGRDSFTVTANLWTGTNATSYSLRMDGAEVASGPLTSATPTAQHVNVPVSGLAPGAHVFEVVWINAAGSTTSAPITVTVA